MERNLNTYVHKILEYLKKLDRPASYKEIENNTDINIQKNGGLMNVLRSNTKLIFLNNSIQFVPTYSIKFVEDLLEIVSALKSKEGIEMSILEESPTNVREFVEILKAQNKVIVLKDMDNSEVIFYNEEMFPKIDDRIKAMWDSIKIPPHYDIVNELSQAGLKSNENQMVKKSRIIIKPASSKYKRRINITNTHVKGLDLAGMDDSSS